MTEKQGNIIIAWLTAINLWLFAFWIGSFAQ